MVALSVFTQLCPVGQSADVWQASWQIPLMHACSPVQSVGDRQGVRQCRSDEHTNTPLQDNVFEQSDSAGS